MRINLNTKKKQKTIKKLTNNSNNNFYNLKLQTHNNTIINPYVKWSKCNTSKFKNLKKGSFDKKDTSNLNLYLNNLAVIEKKIKIRNKSIKVENYFQKKVEIELSSKNNIILNQLDSNIEKDINPKYIDNNNNNNNNNNIIQLIEKEKMEKDKELKEEQLLKKKIQEEENLKKLKKCYSNTPYSSIINPENKFNICDHDNDDNYYNNLYTNNNDNNEDILKDNDKDYIQDKNEENYKNIIHNIKATKWKNDMSNNSYVNQIPNEILIRIFSNPMFNQNDYYKFCLVCRSWNQAATIVLWNKPYIYSFHQLVKFYQSLLYNEEILKLNNSESSNTAIQLSSPPSHIISSPSIAETKAKSKYINHNLSKLVNKLDLTRVRLERPISTRQRTELYKALNILGDKLMPFLSSLSICREQCNSYLFLGTSVINSGEDYCNQALILSANVKESYSDMDLCFKEMTFPSVHHLKFTDLNYKSVTSLLKSLKKFNQIETLYISIALFQSWKEWNNNNHLNNYLVFQKLIENLRSPQLKKIRLQNCCDLNDQTCYTLFDKCKEITELEILGSSNVSIDVLYYSIKMLKDLKILSYTAISTPQFKLGNENNNDNNTIDNENNEEINRNTNETENENGTETENKKNVKKGLLAIDLSTKPQASNIQIIDINSTGWSPYLNWMFNNQCYNSIKKLILTIQTEEERNTIYKAVSSCQFLEELIINYRHETNDNNEPSITNEQLSIDLDKLFLVKTEDYQSNIKFLHISGLEIENSKRLTKYIENIDLETEKEKEKENEGKIKSELEDNLNDQSENLRFKKLKYLHLYLPSSKCPIEYILYQFPCLEEFVLNLSEPIEDELLDNNETNVINAELQEEENNENNNAAEENDDNNNGANIEIINTNDNNNINIKKLNFFKKIYSHLKRLSIRSSSFGDGFSIKQINSIIEKCTSITNLELDCKSLTEDCLCHIIEILKEKLISLRLERVNRSTITDKFLSYLCQTNPLIQQLEIFAEHGKLDVTYEGTNNIIEKCKNLRYFSLGLEGFNPIIPYNLEQPSNYRSYFKILNYNSKKKFI